MINLIRSGTLKVGGKPMKVGAKPGVTRALQTKLRVSDDPLVFLLDTPGVTMPNIRNIDTGMKLAACATLKDEQVGIFNIADFILFNLNKNSMFDYVDVMSLQEPVDDVMEMLIQSATAKNRFRKISKSILGKETEVPCTDDTADEFIHAFRRGE